VIEFATQEDAPAVERTVNAAYNAGEAGIWMEGWKRIALESVEALIARGEIAVARRDADGEVIGSVRVLRLDDETAELGMLSVAPEAFGTGTGRELLTFAERYYDTDFMQLELLVPHGAPLPSKVRLHEWYTRLGYREISRRNFDEPLLIGPADLVTYRKTLTTAA
jgi:ribosomal protein S18 acetylase RimI-like enzyme